MRKARHWLVFVVGLGACQAGSAPSNHSCKPEAPIAVEVTTTPISGSELEVTARAVPTTSVASLDLAVALPAHARTSSTTQARYGATAAGESRVLVARVNVDQRSSSITAIARVPVEGIDMSRTATVAIGAPVPAPRTRTYALPDGELAREVRP